MTIDEILNNYSFFSRLTPSIREAMLDIGKVVALENNSSYFSEGDSCISIALVGMGSVVVYKIGDNGRTIVLYRVGPGQICILSTSCMFSRNPLPAHAKTESFTEAVVFPVSYFQDWIDADRVLRSFIIDTLSLRMNKVVSLVEEIAFGRIDRRLAEFLVAKFDNNGLPLNSLTITHESIANELGTAREVVSRVLKQFENNGTIELTRGKILLKNFSEIQHIADMI